LFPHLFGEELPLTKWNEDKSQLQVSFKDQQDLFYFKKIRMAEQGLGW